ncbi:hypothetical protein H6P81_009831 [Aristolochia fimbriata]|uniref:Uncharacterized protein n=1 Tax=Aristolochia fimbriata TaxID=158543 RepID=A0AAV7EQ90_ARIFI|nr:hypothetical protein H6P81_009831 [Aristolochia fimbriata]
MTEPTRRDSVDNRLQMKKAGEIQKNSASPSANHQRPQQQKFVSFANEIKYRFQTQKALNCPERIALMQELKTTDRQPISAGGKEHAYRADKEAYHRVTEDALLLPLRRRMSKDEQRKQKKGYACGTSR